MPTTILRRNAIPVYGFLSFINTQLPENETLQGKSILDCGAGGILPPLTIFAEHGMQTFGTDISERSLQNAESYIEAKNLNTDLRKGDMRQLPFEDNSFDYVYEHYSMCHLNKKETPLAVNEIFRVLKKGGIAFLGVMSTDSWPKMLFGEEREPGEFWMIENGHESSHTFFTQQEVDEMMLNWEILLKENKIRYLLDDAAEASMETWMGLYKESPVKIPNDEWGKLYSRRSEFFQYSHLYYYLRKPE